MEGIKNLPSMVKQGYYMVKLDIKKAYLHVPFGLSTVLRIFTMLLRPVLLMLRELKVSVIAYLDDLLIIGSTKEECLSNLDKTMELLVKLGFKLNLEKSVLEPTQSITFLGLQIDSVSMQLLVPKEKKSVFKRKADPLKDAVIPFRLYTRKTNKFHCHCLSLSKGDWDQSFVIPQDVKSEISNWLTQLTQWNGKEESLFPSFDYVLTTDASESCAGATLKKGKRIINTWSFQWSVTQSNIFKPTTQQLSRTSIAKVVKSRINTYSDTTTMEVGDYWPFQSHVKSIINTQKPSTTELFMSSWQPSTLNVGSQL
ncbi:hypothetical protein ACTFIU_009024 [Dictyostelium citrinum]